MKLPLSLVIAAAFTWFLLSPPSFAVETASGKSLVIQQYKKALELDPENINIKYQLAVALLKEKAYDEALSNLLSVYGEMSDDIEINYYMGIAYAGAGRLDEAEAAYKKAEELDPKKASDVYELDRAWYNLGLAYHKKNRPFDALKAYDRSIKTSPEQAAAHCRKGEALFDMKNYNDALESFKTCEARSPGDARVKKYIISTRMAKGLALVNDKKHTEALVEFKKVSEIDPKNENAVYFQGYLYYLLADYKQAIIALSALVTPEGADMIENLPSLYQNIGVELQARNDWATADTAFTRAFELKKNDPDLHYLLGFNCLKNGDYGRAVDEIKETLRLNPAHPKANLALAITIDKLVLQHLKNGDMNVSKGRYAEAVDEFDAVLEIDPENNRGIKGKREAEKRLESVKLDASKKAEADIKERLMQGDRLLREEKYMEALSAFRYALAIDRDNAAAAERIRVAESFIKEKKDKYLHKGDAAAQEGNYWLALKEYKKAIGADPEDATALQKAIDAEGRLTSDTAQFIEEGRAHEENENFPEAIKAYNEALRRYPESIAAVEGKNRASAALDAKFKKLTAKAREHMDGGEYSLAAENYRLAQGLRPDDAGVKDALSRIAEAAKKSAASKLKAADKAMKDGRYASAVAHYEDVLSSDDKNRQASEGLASAKRMLSEENARIRAVMEKEKGRPRKAEGKEVEKLYLKGIELYTEGKYVDAIKVWEKVLEADPKHEKAALNIEKAKRKLEGVMDVK